MARKYKGIIFDFNGVLLWDAPLHVQAWQVTALHLRGSQLSNDEFAVHIHGRTNTYILNYLTNRLLHEDELLNLIQVKESMYRDLCLKNIELFVLSPGAKALLKFISENDIPRTIATASEKTNLNFFVHHFCLEKWFNLREIVYDDGNIPGKPAADMYTKAASNIGLAPHECIVVEDAISGLQSAYAANIGYIVGLGPYAAHNKLLACKGVSKVIESFEQFPYDVLFTA